MNGGDRYQNRKFCGTNNPTLMAGTLTFTGKVLLTCILENSNTLWYPIGWTQVAWTLIGLLRINFQSDGTAGLAGLRAEWNIPSADPCANIVCDQGTCIEGLCECLPGYEGELCEINIDDCAGNPCGNGECLDG